MAYAIWAWGRSGKANQQAAVMLFVHGQMGDARPGEVDPNGVSPAVAEIYDQVAQDTARYHGPYRVVVTSPDRLRVGEQGTATIKVLSASGNALPDVELTLSAEGAGIPSKASTGRRRRHRPVHAEAAPTARRSRRRRSRSPRRCRSSTRRPSRLQPRTDSGWSCPTRRP